MKPTLAMEDKLAATIIQTPEVPNKVSSKGRWILAGLSVILALLTATLVLQTLSYGKLHELSAGHSEKTVPDVVNKELNYHIEETGETIHETITVDDREEDIKTSEARMIVDYYRGILVIKENGEDVDNTKACYAITFDKTKSIEEIKETYLNVEDNGVVDIDQSEKTYKSTNETVPMNLLSPKAQDMCENDVVVMLTEVDRTALDGLVNRNERGVCIRICFWFVCIKICF